MSNQLTTPVLFLVFNRPDNTQKLFEAIRKAKPSRLYVAADGPRANKEGEAERCAITRNIATSVDWDCEVKTLFRDKNLGCKYAVSSAITWFFENEEDGIILEDDCLPDPSFFNFCQELLEKYRNDKRVMLISGTNFMRGWQNDSDYSYYFSKIGSIWGWASWRRAWQLYDLDMKFFPEFVSKKYYKDVFICDDEERVRLGAYERAHTGAVDTWDYQWDFARHVHSGLAIIPNVNLIKNIGFGEDATHTTKPDENIQNMQAATMTFPLKHPPFVIHDMKSDLRDFEMHHSLTPLQKGKELIKSVVPDTIWNKLKETIKGPAEV